MSRGRGQPPTIGAGRYPELLKLLRSGMSMSEAAEAMGVARATLYNLAARDEAMGERMRAAREEGRAAARAAKRNRHEASESCYVNNACRAPACTQAATDARARRRTAEPAPAAAAAPYERHANVYALLAADDTPPLADSA